MNRHLIRLFRSEEKLARLVSWLPEAFEIVRNEMPPRNPAVGILREHILTGFFVNEFGEENVDVPRDGVQRGIDIRLHGVGLSIKTTTGSGTSGVKVLWTVDALQIGREISRDYEPDCDIILVNIFWGKRRESIYYIPVEVQQLVRNELGDGYLHAAVGTNHRGISISAAAIRKLKDHKDTLSASVDWQVTGIDQSPYERWVKYWSEKRST